jgi:hypothetical protein
MKKVILATLMILGTYFADAQSIQTNLDRIQDELNKIMMEASNLPVYKRSAISASVLNIKRILGSNTPDPKDISYNPQERIMTDSEFDNFLLTIKQTSSFETQLMQICRKARNTSFYMDQIHDILKLFNFSSERDKVRDILLPKAIDPENVRQLYDLYRFPSEQKKLEELIDQRPSGYMQAEPDKFKRGAKGIDGM